MKKYIFGAFLFICSVRADEFDVFKDKSFSDALLADCVTSIYSGKTFQNILFEQFNVLSKITPSFNFSLNSHNLEHLEALFSDLKKDILSENAQLHFWHAFHHAQFSSLFQENYYLKRFIARGIHEIIRIETAKSNIVQECIPFDCFDASGPLELKRIGRENDGGYVVPIKAFCNSDALIGYGIADDISFEETFCELTHKPAFGFDGGVTSIPISNPLCTFVSECLGTSDFLYEDQSFSGKSASFQEHLDRFNLNKKKIFLKIDIEGAEYDVFQDILKNADNINGIVLEIHKLDKKDYIFKAAHLLQNISKHFTLVNVHGNNCSFPGFISKNVYPYISASLELTYINTQLLTGRTKKQTFIVPSPLDMPNSTTLPDNSFILNKEK